MKDKGERYLVARYIWEQIEESWPYQETENEEEVTNETDL